MLTIDEIEQSISEINSSPYKDEDTAKEHRLRKENKRLETDNERLKKENKELRAKATNRSPDTMERANESAKGVSDIDAKTNRTDDGTADNRADRSDGSLGAPLSMEATFYTAFCDTGCTGVTATGVDVSQTIYHAGKRVIAVDPSVIALGSTVKVALEDGNTFEATAQDTGGDIQGNRIDILVASKEEARRLGRQAVKVSVIK